MKVYLVGGAVRDRIMGVTAHDSDYVVVGSSIEEMLSRGFVPVGKIFPVFIKKGEKKEYALARKEIKTGLKHTDFRFFFDKSITLQEDLARRDFTCNAIAYDEESDVFIDYYNGLEDIVNRTLRHINSHFSEDPLRVIRLCRFAAQLNFSVAPETMALSREIVQTHQLRYLSPERIWNEIKRALQYPNFYRFIEVAHECNALQEIMPCVEKLWFTRSRFGEKMLIESTISCLKEVANDTEIVKFATLLHNIGEVRALGKSDLSDMDREEFGISMIKQLCRSLRIPSGYQKFAVLTCKNYRNFSLIDSMSLESLLDIIDEYMRKIPDHFEDFIGTLKIGVGDKLSRLRLKKSQKRIREIHSLLSSISAYDVPDFENLRKDSSFRDKYRAFKLKILGQRGYN